jgi:hypothetical protein
VIFFHPTMRERGIRKCSKRGVSMAKFFGLSFWQEYFFQPTFLQNLVCSINDLFNFQYSQEKTR